VLGVALIIYGAPPGPGSIAATDATATMCPRPAMAGSIAERMVLKTPVWLIAVTWS
jgi:hypothetical protein